VTALHRWCGVRSDETGAQNGTILDEEGRVSAAFHDARARGVLFDVGHGVSCSALRGSAAVSGSLAPSLCFSALAQLIARYRTVVAIARTGLLQLDGVRASRGRRCACACLCPAPPHSGARRPAWPHRLAPLVTPCRAVATVGTVEEPARSPRLQPRHYLLGSAHWRRERYCLRPAHLPHQIHGHGHELVRRRPGCHSHPSGGTQPT